MFHSAVSVLVDAQSSSEIPEGLMNNPVYNIIWGMVGEEKSVNDVEGSGRGLTSYNIPSCVCKNWKKHDKLRALGLYVAILYISSRTFSSATGMKKLCRPVWHSVHTSNSNSATRRSGVALPNCAKISCPVFVAFGLAWLTVFLPAPTSLYNRARRLLHERGSLFVKATDEWLPAADTVHRISSRRTAEKMWFSTSIFGRMVNKLCSM